MDSSGSEGILGVVLRRSETAGRGLGLGFSIIGGIGYDFPPVLYDIEKDSPAEICGMLEAGDVILSVNEREVVKLSTKEVLKCLRLSGDIVHIKFKRDPHVVSRVRQFLSTPNYPMGDVSSTTPSHQDNNHHNRLHHHHSSPLKQHNSQSQTNHNIKTTSLNSTNSTTTKRGSQIPVYQPTSSSPSHRAAAAVVATPSPEHHPKKTSSSFNDELFINHSFDHHATSSNKVLHSPTVNKVQAHIHVLQDKQQAVPTSRNGGAGGGRARNFETFVMTGDAILSKDLSKNEANPLLSSPRKPVVVRTITDVVMPRREETTCLVDKSESDETPTPPTFPPPPSELNNSYNSDEAKGALPPPPPPEEVAQKNGGCGKCHDKKNKTNGVPNKKTFYPNYRDDVEDEEEENYSGNNTEDTSISSSVMSDDDDDNAVCCDQIFPGCEEDAVVAEVNVDAGRTTTSPVAGCSKNLMGNGNGNYYNGIKTGPIAATGMTREDSYDGGGGTVEKGVSSAPASFEKERYAEYILVNETDFSPRHGPTTTGGPQHSNSYSQAINSKTTTTPPPKHQNSLPRDTSSSFSTHDEDEDLSSSSTTTSTNSENDPFQQEGGLSSARHNTDSISGGESDSSDVESVCVPPVTKAVDVPSAIRLGKRLWALDGFRSGDVWRHLCKNTEYNRIVAIEYLSNFNFTGETVDVALRKFLATCPLKGETQERERVLSYFALRYLENNPGLQFSSPDAVHTITCAIMLLNTDLYAGANKERMTCPQFIENLSGLNDGKNFNKETLKLLYLSVRKKPLVSPGDIDDVVANPANRAARMGLEDQAVASVTDLTKSMDYRTGYLMRKSTHELGGKKTPFGKRSWKIFFCRLKELVLLLLADEGNCSVPTYQIKLHHAFASPASDYRKRKNVLRLVLADSSQFLLQASDPRELTSWVELLNWNAARFSAPALEAPISSTGRFQKPLLPSCITALCRDEQVATHLRAQQHWEKQLGFYTPPVKETPPPKKGKGKGSSIDPNPPVASSLPPPPPPPFSSASSSNPPFPPLLLLSYAHVKKEDREKVLFFQSEILRYHTYLTLLEKLGQSEPDVGHQQAPSPPPPVDLNRLPNPPIILHEEEDDD